MRLRHAAAQALLSATLAAAAFAQAQAPTPRAPRGGNAPRTGAAPRTYDVPIALRAGRWSSRRVELAGSFNEWRPQEMGFTRGGSWLSYVRLAPGRHLYKFVVDGRWITDPFNPEVELDGRGNVNSVLRVEAAPGGSFRTNFLTGEELRRRGIEDRMLDAGGGRLLHVYCAGRGPSVLMEAGHANSSQPWLTVVPEVARFARVCVYDRAGVGGSDPPSALPRTADQLLSDLDLVVGRSGLLRAPVVLVGHSLGGVLVRLYAARHPARVAGLVLVDAAHEDQEVRQLAVVPEEVKAQFSEEERRVSSPEGIDFEQLFAAARAERRRHALPLVVLTATRVDLSADPRIAPYVARFEEIRRELQRELARDSTRGRQVLADRSGHFIHWDQPELVVESIRRVSKESGGRKK